MEIKLELDTENALKAIVAIAAAYGLCRVSADTKYPQACHSKRDRSYCNHHGSLRPTPGPEEHEICLNTIKHGGSLLHGASHDEAAGPQRD